MKEDEFNNNLDNDDEEYGEENSSKAGRLIAGVAGLVLIIVATYYLFSDDLGTSKIKYVLGLGGLGGVLLFFAIFQGKNRQE